MNHKAKTKNTRTRLVEAAAWLIHRNGYHGTGLSDILARSNAPKGVLYYHFPDGKPALGAAALELTALFYNRQIIKAGSRVRTVKGYVRALADLTRKDLILSDYRAGCPLATTALETAPEDERLTEACRNGFELWIQTTAERLQQFGLPAKKARDYAEIAMAGFEGALAIARTRKDTKIIDLSAGGLIRMLEADGY